VFNRARILACWQGSRLTDCVSAIGGDSAAPSVSGWLRSARKVQGLDLSASVTMDTFSKEMDVRPGVKICFRDLDKPSEVAT
jgi:hypothetical protein